jgi:hypothetical protein
MKSPQLKRISIPDPCTIPWDTMNPVTPQQRHCSSCDRVITDFTKMSDAELISFFNTNHHACGKFSPHQLNRELKIDRTITRAGSWKNIFMIPALLLGIETFAREKPNPGENKVVSSFIENVVENNSEQPTVNSTNDSLVISGYVTDSVTGEAVLFALVYLEDHSVSATTDVNGYFSVKIPNPGENSSVNIVVQNIGYVTTTTRKANLTGATMHIGLEPAETHMVGIVITDDSPRSKTHRFFHKLFHPRYW